MIEIPAPPEIASLQEYRSRTGDVDFWWPHLTRILQRHDLYESGVEPLAGHNVTYPTFVCGEAVVKLFGYLPSAIASYTAERGALGLANTDSEIAAPRLLADGEMSADPGSPWTYLITRRISGVESWRAGLSAIQWQAIASDLGRQVKRIHALTPANVATHEDWANVDVTLAAEHSSLPPHLIAQVSDYVGRLGPFDRAFVHADVVANHVFVENGRITGIIDWGDALVTDRHVELIQIYRDSFDCDKALFRRFLEVSEWPVARDFPRRALGFALHRQALGMAQHPSIDVFQPIAEKYPFQDIATLDELAEELFGV